MKSTRERQERFIASSGKPYALARYAELMLLRHGTSWLTDEQVADIATRDVAQARYSLHLIIRNRKLRSAP
jgi:hypothetical protein